MVIIGRDINNTEGKQLNMKINQNMVLAQALSQAVDKVIGL